MVGNWPARALWDRTKASFSSTVSAQGVGLESRDMNRPGASLVNKLQAPWRDRTGRLSPLKAITLALLTLPGLPFLMTAMYFWLMGWRLLDRYSDGRDPMKLMALAVACALLVLVFQIVWLIFWQSIPPLETIGYTFSLALGLDATWQVLILGSATAAVAALFGHGNDGQRRLVRRAAGIFRRPLI